ncbi:receptor-type tyrosine-protein phosphatase N2 [Hypomesus transpacificus]|uniref:receptor-type tyrosine-protein phosphatase N2 n=1 Tax=Hypomesus transpacificus TaxID=137520 RepID=UPI001F077BB7|nr:receptor-type tyrosine-protein phosphatase N2 [Hypomesus transpacificus]
MDSRCSILAVLALCLSYSTTISANRKYGCLFEDELCTPYEFCTNDGVFGRCQELQGEDLYTYKVSPLALQRLRTLLQKLTHQGLTWQDDVTQRVISRELSRLHKVPLRRPAPPISPLAHHQDRTLRPGEAELGRKLQQHLKDMGFLPQTVGTTRLGVQRERPLTQDFQNDGRVGDTQPKSQGWGKTTFYSLQPQGLKALIQGKTGKIPPMAAAYSSTYPGKARPRLLASQLESYLSTLPTSQNRPGSPEEKPKAKVHYFSYVSHPPSDGETKGGSKPPKPKIEKLIFKSGSNRPVSKQPLSPTDERFIQNVVNQLGRHSINMGTLRGPNLDQLADVIAGALQGVDGQGPKPRTRPEAKREPLDTVDQDLDQDQDQDVDTIQQDMLERDATRQGQPIGDVEKEPDMKDTAFLSKLLHYLDLDPFRDAPGSPAQPSGVSPGAGPQRTVGLENVQSRTTQGQVPIPHPWEERNVAESRTDEGGDLSGPLEVVGAAVVVDTEVERWRTETPPTQARVEPQKKDMKVKQEVVHLGVKAFSTKGKDSSDFGYIITDSDSLPTDQGLDLMERLAQRLNLRLTDLQQLSVLGPAVTFRVGPNPHNVSTADVAHVAAQQKQQLEQEAGLKILESGVSDRASLTQIPVVKETRVESGQFLVLSVLSMLFILGVLVSSGALFFLRQRSHLQMKEKLVSLGTDTGADATATYQELCRQRMAVRTSERVERPETRRHSRLNSVSSQFSDGPAASPSARSSTSSWCDEPVPSNMDISTGHMILSYMEDHLKNKNRLEREWEALCSYQAEPSTCDVGKGEQNNKRNRSDAVIVYDHSRITLKAENNHGNSDYINASPIMDHDPRNPTYISSQGPLPSTVADFWQMVWENGCVVIVMLTPLSENGVKQCHPYWPDEGSDIYHIYEVNLVSEHIWCEDFLVRSFYLKNLQTNETRTVTQFHFLSWVERGIPDSARTLLDFRRKVNKCYRGRSCPIIVHCSDGAGRSGTYILIDMVLNRMGKGAKEIDIAATLEHLRDQRPGMVQTKEQFEFALTAVAEEVNAILKALPQ